MPATPTGSWKRHWFGTRARLTQPGFVRSSLALISGTVASQAILFLLSPFLSRLFSPADFGDLANFNAWVSILGLLSNLRYEHAIIVARGRIGMNRVMALATVLSLASVAIVAVAAGVIAMARPSGGYLGTIQDIVWFIPAGVLAMVVSSLLIQFGIRRGKFRRIAAVNVTQVVVTVAVQLALGVGGVRHGLVLGTVGGSFLAAGLFLALHLRGNRLRHVWREMRPAQLRATALEHLNFPRFTLAADGMNVLVQQFVPVFLTAMFSPFVAGLYSFSTRVVRVPAFVVSSAVSTVLRKHAGEHLRRYGDLHVLFRRLVTGLTLLAIPPFVVLALFAASIFGVLFGTEWSEAGRLVQILSPGIMLEFIAMPLTVLFLITHTQRFAFRIQLANVATLALALLIGRRMGSFIAAAWLIAGAMAAVNVLTIVLAARVSRRRFPGAA